MTTVKQVVPFDLSKMGTAEGWCEKNVRLGYGLPAVFPDAKTDMEFNRDRGLLHSMDTLPKNGAVPVFVDTASEYEHVMVAIDGVLYSDGVKVDDWSKWKFFGWGESFESYRVVDIVPDPVPEPMPTPEPAPEPTPEPVEFKEGDIVVPTRLVDYNGTPLVQYDDNYVITQINGDRAVLSANRNGNLIVWASMNTKDIKKA